ncbi:Uncharacterised protein [Mycobacteroides abscessus subsp. abscessus]|nr:Uncharacterised protein [Mycobacteroides abscessus subsp. abscessus]
MAVGVRQHLALAPVPVVGSGPRLRARQDRPVVVRLRLC